MKALICLLLLSSFSLSANANYLTDKAGEMFDYAYAKLSPEKKGKLDNLRQKAGAELKKNSAPLDPKIAITRTFVCISGETSMLGVQLGICAEVSMHYLPSFAVLYANGDDFEAVDANVFALMYSGPPTSLEGSTFKPTDAQDGDGILDQMIQNYGDAENKARTLAVAGMALIPGESAPSDL